MSFCAGQPQRLKTNISRYCISQIPYDVLTNFRYFHVKDMSQVLLASNLDSLFLYSLYVVISLFYTICMWHCHYPPQGPLSKGLGLKPVYSSEGYKSFRLCWKHLGKGLRLPLPRVPCSWRLRWRYMWNLFWWLVTSGAMRSTWRSNSSWYCRKEQGELEQFRQNHSSVGGSGSTSACGRLLGTCSSRTGGGG